MQPGSCKRRRFTPFRKSAKRTDIYTLTHLLDLGCGGGHIAYTAAPLVEKITAYDMNESMLDCVTETARQRQLSNISICQGIAESLPFDNDQFDIVASRYSAHHWYDVPKALYEAHRVLQSNGTLMIMDVISPGHPLLDSYLQTIEMLRDTSHVRDYALREWTSFIEQTGFMITQVHTFNLYLDYPTWIQRMNHTSCFFECHY